MQPDDIIKLFEVYVDDLTELSTYEEYQVLSKVLDTIYNDRSWEFLRSGGSLTTDANGEATLTSDFACFMPNYIADDYNNIPEKTVIWVDGIPFDVIPMGARTQKVNQNCAYIEGNKLKFTSPVINKVVTFDYKYIPDDITSNSSVIRLPKQFHKYLPQIMAIDDDIIQKSEKARSNYNENVAIYKKLIIDLAHHNARSLNY